MGPWQTADPNQRFSEPVESAGKAGPQIVLLHRDPVAVILSPDDYRRLVRQADANFGNRLAGSPLEHGDVEPVGMSFAGDG